MECFGGHSTVSLSPIVIKCVIRDDYKGYNITMSVKSGNLEGLSLTVVHRFRNLMYRNISMKEFKTKNLESLNLPEFFLIGVPLLNCHTLHKITYLWPQTLVVRNSLENNNLLCP